MKTSQYKIWLVLALALAGGWSVTAQRYRSSGSAPKVPGPNDYDQFAQFITTRNIFNPQRYASTGEVAPRINQQPRYAPQFTYVGTMNYGKGIFAFFDGNQSELRKVLYPSDGNTIAGYVLTGITSTNVTLQTADKKRTVWMKIGDSMRQEGSEWVPSGQGGMAYSSTTESSTPSAESSGTEGSSTSAPSTALQGNDILKKLMQQRQQELK